MSMMAHAAAVGDLATTLGGAATRSRVVGKEATAIMPYMDDVPTRAGLGNNPVQAC
jgi:hypothetical protein